jgi:ribosomal protein S4
MNVALQIINQGKLKINNKRIRTPNYICSSKDTISIQTKKGVREIKLSQFKLN